MTAYYEKKNWFGNNLYSPLIIWELGGEMESLVFKKMAPLFELYGLNSQQAFDRIKTICNSALSTKGSTCSLQEVTVKAEKNIRNFLYQQGKEKLIEMSMLNRAKLISNQIKRPIEQYMSGDPFSLADVGCGDGLVTANLHDEINIQNSVIADVLDYRNERVKHRDDFNWYHLPDHAYRKISSSGNKKFDCVLLITVLHHAEDPKSVITACLNSLKPGGLIVVMESCVGVDLESVKNSVSVLTKKTLLNQLDKVVTIEQYCSLDFEGQMIYGTFMDWFYNRVLHKDINTPYNFNTSDAWNDMFDRCGAKLITEYFEGFDQITVPEFHTIHVYQKED